MNAFTLKGKQGFIRIELQEAIGFPYETSPFGGYDAKGTVEIKCGNYYVLGKLWFSTFEAYQFYKQLETCYSQLEGEAVFWNDEISLQIKVKFIQQGQVLICGYYKEKADSKNELHFEIESDQSYLSSTLNELKLFVYSNGRENNR